MKKQNKRKLWSQSQDQIMRGIIQKYGKKWAIVSWQLKKIACTKKSPKQCRERWYNQLDPSIVKKQWTQEQENFLLQEHQKHGSKWKAIAEKLEGRTQNSIKNHFYSMIRKILRKINKFLGTKNGSAKVRKIKSSTITKFFSFNQPPSQSQQSKCEKIAYNLINFGYKKLKDKQTMSDKDYEDFSILLQKMHETNDQYEKQRKVRRSMKRQNQSQSIDDQQNSQNSQNIELSQEEDEEQSSQSNYSEFKYKHKKKQGRKAKKRINMADRYLEQQYNQQNPNRNQCSQLKIQQGQNEKVEERRQDIENKQKQKVTVKEQANADLLNPLVFQRQQQTKQKFPNEFFKRNLPEIYERMKQEIRKEVMAEVKENFSQLFFPGHNTVLIVPNSSVIINGPAMNPYQYFQNRLR